MQNLEDLIARVNQLLDERDGCPWMLQQDYASIASYSLDEVYELLDAIRTKDPLAMSGELSDLLFHIVILSQMAEKEGHFSLSDVVDRSIEKLQRRRTVDHDKQMTAAQAHAHWEQEKFAQKRADLGSLSADIPLSSPALLMTIKLHALCQQLPFSLSCDVEQLQNASSVSFARLTEIALSSDVALKNKAFGACLFTLVRFACSVNVNPERALRDVNNQLLLQIQTFEKILSEAKLDMSMLTPVQFDDYWDKASGDCD